MWSTCPRIFSKHAAFLLVCFCAATVLFMGGCVSYRSGQAEARKELAEGKLGVARYGLYSDDWATAYRLAEVKYSIKSRGFGCIVTDDDIDWVRGYNSVMSPAIEAKYGKDWRHTLLAEVKAMSPDDVKKLESQYSR
ncbi:MAG: hypothetical protein SFY96_00425 [Planctomycetota bacterium]|nr:hypothetical protein [Planctomycetota bacterium]